MPAKDLSDTLRALSEQSATLRAASGNVEAPSSSAADIFSDPMFAGCAPHYQQWRVLCASDTVESHAAP